MNASTPYRSPFAKIVAQARPAPFTDTIGNWIFQDEWTDKPEGDVCFGFRQLSNTDIDFCRGEAQKKARAMYPGVDASQDDDLVDEATRTYNDLLMRFAVSRGTCDPNDVRKPHPVWQGMGDDLVHDALTVEGTKHLYDQLEKATIATSQTQREIQDDELEELLKAPHALGAMPDWHARRVRRLLAWCVDACRAAVPQRERVLPPPPDAAATE